MGKFFGTDGVRGVANGDLLPEFAFSLGRCVGARLLVARVRPPESSARPFALIGRDTRRSGSMFEAALTAGLCSVGVDVWLLGVAPTPGVAWLTRETDAGAGIVISASHNPAGDNGIKVFSAEGFKLSEGEEMALEALLETPSGVVSRPTGEGLGRAEHREDLIRNYADALVRLVPEGLSGLRVGMDCAHGAAYKVAPMVFERLGAVVSPLGIDPNGDNINAGVGSTHLEALQALVIDQRLELGVAFDGDADRCLAVDDAGNVVDGDKIMFICLRHLRALGRLKSGDVVTTVMSNMGFEEAVHREGGRVLRTQVGDRYVLEEMLRQGIRFGGEQSGHIIFLDDNTTGDGLLTALRLVKAFRQVGRPLREMAKEVKSYPQLLRNVRVNSLAGWKDNRRIKQAICQAEQRLVGRGRLVVRASGTEPLIRVMAEGHDERLVLEIVEWVCDEVGGALF